MFSIDVQVGKSSPARLAVVADTDLEQRTAVSRQLEALGFTVAQASDGYEALSIIGEREPGIALLRSHAESDDGERIAALARMLYPRTRIIMTTGPADARTGDDAFTVLTLPADARGLDRCLLEAA
ncbi:response regulator [Azospirillum sp.]|uniref:response regulator n=1 Tax=Azospirillum sp. TaxID=34012 RepID=UPI003D7101F2